MNYSEKLIRAYKKNFKPDMKNAYIQFKTRNDIAIWSNDPVYVVNMIFAKQNGNTVYFGKYENEIREKAEKLQLVVYETDPINHKFTVCIPKGLLIDVAMNVENKENIDEEFISDSAVISYNGLMFYTDTMDNENLKNYFMHKEEMYGG